MTKNVLQSKREVISYVGQRKNRELLEILYAAKGPLKFSDILVDYGECPPIASITFSLHEGRRLDLIAAANYRKGKMMTTMYTLTESGEKLLRSHK